MHLVDDIIVIQNGRIAEHGSFNQLMKQKGDLARLVGEHVQIIEPTHTLQPHEAPEQLELTSTAELTPEQIQNRRRLSRTLHISESDDAEIAKYIEAGQNGLLGNGRESNDVITVLERNRMSIVTESDESDEPVRPDDAEPMKLVQDDQSVLYKKSAFVSYFRSGWGFTITALIIFFFYVVYLPRIGGGQCLFTCSIF